MNTLIDHCMQHQRGVTAALCGLALFLLVVLAFVERK